jgi:hypothetical protein
MSKEVETDGYMLKLLRNKNVAAVDPHNKIVYLKREKKEDVFKFTSYGYRVYTVGEIHFVNENAGRYVMPLGCSPADVTDGNVVITALHCISDADMRPQKTATLLVVNNSLLEIARIEASLKSYTPVKKCGRLCKLYLFFWWLPKSYINRREIAWLEAPVNLSRYKPLPELETVGFLTAASTEGDYMMFSPLPGKEDKIRTGVHIAYTSFDYRKNQIVYIKTTVAGYALANIDGFIFYLPYAYEPGRILAIPGYSGSAIKIIDINGISDVFNG